MSASTRRRLRPHARRRCFAAAAGAIALVGWLVGAAVPAAADETEVRVSGVLHERHRLPAL